MSEFEWRMHILVERESLPAAKRAAAGTLPGSEDEGLMFGVGLGADGSDLSDPSDLSDAAFYGCSTLLTGAQRDDLMRAFEASGVRLAWVCMRAEEQETVAASAGIAVEAGRTWDWHDTLAAIAAREGDDG